MKRLVAAAMIVPLIAGCTQVRQINPSASATDVEMVNKHVRGRTAEVHVENADEFIARDVIVGTDSTRVFQLTPEMGGKTLDNSSIRSLTVTNRPDGAMRGLGLGLLAGATIGGVIGAATVDDNYSAPGDPMSMSESVGVGVVLMGIMGAVCGLVLGSIVGERETYEFTVEEKATATPRQRSRGE